jgi:hypothetical protein
VKAVLKRVLNAVQQTIEVLPDHFTFDNPPEKPKQKRSVKITCRV